MIRDLICYLRYRSACRLMQRSMPGMHATFEPIGLQVWLKSELYYRPSWKTFLFPEKAGK